MRNQARLSETEVDESGESGDVAVSRPVTGW